MLLAELEVWHTRPVTPTRRVALGHLILPADPPPGFGGLLLGAVVAGHLSQVDDDVLPDIHRLIDQVHRGDRVSQPRLRHRFQVDRHGLARSVHRLVGEDDELNFEFTNNGTALQQVLGAVYAVERLAPAARTSLAPVLHRSISWRGPVGPALIKHLLGAEMASIGSLADPRAWALEILGFPVGSAVPSKKEVLAQFRARLREVHPDVGGESVGASKAIIDLGEARRILVG
jgi:hypothetical protein